MEELKRCIQLTVDRYPAHLREDLTQELWLTGLQIIDDFDESKGTLVTFTYKRFHGVCKNWIAKHIQPHADLKPSHLTEDPVDLDVADHIPAPGVKSFITNRLEEGYTLREIYYKWPEHHGYKSLASLYNCVKR